VTNHFFDGAGETAVGLQKDRVAAFWTALRSIMSNNCVITIEPEAVELSPTDGTLTGTVSSPAVVITGSGTGDRLPVATQGLIQWNTGVFIGGRRIVGKTYVPGIVEAANEFGVNPTASAQTTMNNAAIALLEPLDAPFGVWSRKNGVFVEATSGTVKPIWAVLRSRRN
jgi:hypothetical protein